MTKKAVTKANKKKKKIKSEEQEFLPHDMIIQKSMVNSSKAHLNCPKNHSDAQLTLFFSPLFKQIVQM